MSLAIAGVVILFGTGVKDCRIAAGPVVNVVTSAMALPFLSGSGSNSADPPACPAQMKNSLKGNGVASDFLHGVKAPKAIYQQPEPEFTDKARKALRKEMEKQHLTQWEGISVLSMIVGENGIPGDVCVKKPAGYGLDAQAAKTAALYRFEPAMNDGKPVPARIDIEFSFRLR